MVVSISSARAEKANLQTIRERRLNTRSRSEVVPPPGKKLGEPSLVLVPLSASYEIPGAISEGESYESS